MNLYPSSEYLVQLRKKYIILLSYLNIPYTHAYEDTKHRDSFQHKFLLPRLLYLFVKRNPMCNQPPVNRNRFVDSRFLIIVNLSATSNNIYIIYLFIYNESASSCTRRRPFQTSPTDRHPEPRVKERERMLYTTHIPA